MKGNGEKDLGFGSS